MSIQSEWYDNEKKRLLWKFPQKWTWDDFYWFFDNVRINFYSTPHRIKVVADLSQTDSMPEHMEAHILSFANNLHPQVEQFVWVGNPQLVDNIVSFLKARDHKNAAVFSTAYNLSDALS